MVVRDERRELEVLASQLLILDAPLAPLIGIPDQHAVGNRTGRDIPQPAPRLVERPEADGAEALIDLCQVRVDRGGHVAAAGSARVEEHHELLDDPRVEGPNELVEERPVVERLGLPEPSGQQDADAPLGEALEQADMA